MCHAPGQLAYGFHLLGLAKRLFQSGAFLHFSLQFFVCGLQLCGADHDVVFQLFGLLLRRAGQPPFFRQRVCQLEGLDVVEGFLQNDQLICPRKFADDFIERIICVGRADNRLQFRLNFPDPGNRLDAIPARRHPHVYECHGIRTTFGQRGLYLGQPFLTLKGGI
ncbi:MAG: hypothetical protein QM813_22080 [Verrucomicrobiota bacterium]